LTWIKFSRHGCPGGAIVAISARPADGYSGRRIYIASPEIRDGPDFTEIGNVLPTVPR